MKSTEPFKKAIEAHLKYRGFQDPLFAETLKKENKNLDDCITYILNQVKSSGKNGFTDDEIFGMAVHYYDEDDVKIGDKFSGTVVVNHQVELTPEEIAEAKKIAYDQVIEKETKRLTGESKKQKASKKQKEIKTENTLFDEAEN